MDKYNELYDEVTRMLIWAEEQRHINLEQRDLLLDNLIKIKLDIDRNRDK